MVRTPRSAETNCGRRVQVVAVQAADEGDLLVWADGEPLASRFVLYPRRDQPIAHGAVSFYH